MQEENNNKIGYRDKFIELLEEDTTLKLVDEDSEILERTDYVKIRCQCGYEFESCYIYMKHNKIKSCKKCRSKIQTDKKSKKLKDVLKYAEETLPHIKVITDYYVSQKQIMEFYCSVHKINFSSEVRAFMLNSNGCRQCFVDSITGENNKNYKQDMPNEERLKYRKGSKLARWRIELLSIYNNKCIICGHSKEYNLIAHHKNSHDWCKEEAYDIDNGTIVCRNCHNEFHYIYGYGNNTKEQFEEYSKQFKKLK